MPEVRTVPAVGVDEDALRRLLEASEEALEQLPHARDCPRSVVESAECLCLRSRLASSIDEVRSGLGEPMRAIFFPVTGTPEEHVAPFNLGALLRQTLGLDFALLPRSAYAREDVQVFWGENADAPANPAATEHLRAPHPLRGPILVLENLPDDPERP